MQSSFREILLLYDIIYLIHKELSVVHSVCFIQPRFIRGFFLPFSHLFPTYVVLGMRSNKP